MTSVKSAQSIRKLAQSRINERRNKREMSHSSDDNTHSLNPNSGIAVIQLRELRRLQLKESERAKISREDISNASSNDKVGTVDASRLFDLDGGDALVQLCRSHQLFLLSSMFAEDVLLGDSECVSCSGPDTVLCENRTKGIVHVWNLNTCLRKNLFIGWYTFPTKFGTNIKLGDNSNQSFDDKQSPCEKTLKTKPDKSSVLLYSPQVGMYMPVAPPLGCVLLDSGKARASDRILYQAATETFRNSNNKMISHMQELYASEGSLRAGLNPLEHYHQRPPLSFSAEHDILRKQCAHLASHICQPGYAGVVTHGIAHTTELQFSIARVALYDHPLFGPEDRLYAQMRLLYGEYHRHLKAQTGNYLKLRLQILLKTVMKSQIATAPELKLAHSKPGKWDSGIVSSNCFQTLELLVQEEQTIIELAEALYTTWNQLKGLRQHQRFTSTPAKLVAINVHHSHTSSSRTQQPYPIKKILDHFQTMVKSIAWHASIHIAEVDNRRIHQERLVALFRKCRRLLISTSDFVLKLYTTAELTYDDDKSLPIQEIMRRRRVQQQRFYVILAVNDHKVTTLLPHPIAWPAFTIQLDQPLRLRVARRPIRLEVQLWQRRLLVDMRLATILVPIPGIASCHGANTVQSLAPLTSWLQFASAEIRWDVNFVIGEDIEMFLDRKNATKSPWQLFGRNKGDKADIWIRGVVVAVRWRSYDIQIQTGCTTRDRLHRAVPASRIRRSGVVFEVRQRQLTGAALIAVQWTIADLQSSLQSWDLGTHSKSFVEMQFLPPRPNESGYRNLGQCQLMSSSDPYFKIGSSTVPLNELGIPDYLFTVGRAESDFDPNDPRCASLVNQFSIISACGNVGLQDVFRAQESCTRLVFRAVRGRGAYRKLSMSTRSGVQHMSKGTLHLNASTENNRTTETLGTTLDNYNQIAPSSRHRLLRLRMHQPTLINEPIPATDSAALNNIFLRELVTQDDSRRQRTTRSLEKANELARMRYKHETKGNNRVLAFVQQVKDCITERGRTLSHTHFPLSALVSEGAPLPQLRARGLVDAALEFTARRRRALRPPRRRRTAVASPTSDCSLLVQVISAHHIAESTLTASKRDYHNPSDENSVSNKEVTETGTFVSATFQEHHRRTMLALGYTPRWKETLDLPFIPALGDFSPTNLMQVIDCLRLNLFSESTPGLLGRDKSHDSNALGSSASRRVFLGDVEIPFTTIYCSGGIDGILEGKFRLRTPAVKLSTYDLHNSKTTPTAHLSRGEETSREEAVSNSYVHLAIFLRPPLSAPTKNPSIVSSLEEESLIRYGTCWIQQLRMYLENINEVIKRPIDGRIPKRVVEVFGKNIKGDAVLICRYLCPQQPPPGIKSFTQVARFVSLIPFLDDWQSFGCANLDVWCTSQEFLDIGAGDWEEHGILLHNLIWWLQLNVMAVSTSDDLYLVIGSGIPEGNTVYVMQRKYSNTMRDAERILFWNACSGNVFLVTDKQCPLVDIGCILNPLNVYANLQGVTIPHLLSYDINDNSNWRPFFADPLHRNIGCFSGCTCICNPGPTQISRPTMLTSVQEMRLRYDAPDVLQAETIQAELTEEVKMYAQRLIRRWRASQRDRYVHTSFNVDISRRLQNLLPTLEGLCEADGLSQHALERHKHDALGTGQIWDLEAMAFNMPFTSINSIVDRLRATNIHEIYRRDVQFIVGVYVHPIVHRIFSVFVSVSRQRLYIMKSKTIHRYGSIMEQYLHDLRVEYSVQYIIPAHGEQILVHLGLFSCKLPRQLFYASLVSTPGNYYKLPWSLPRQDSLYCWLYHSRTQSAQQPSDSAGRRNSQFLTPIRAPRTPVHSGISVRGPDRKYAEESSEPYRRAQV